MIMLHLLAARVKKPVAMFGSVLFVIKPPIHRSSKQNLRLLYLRRGPLSDGLLPIPRRRLKRFCGGRWAKTGAAMGRHAGFPGEFDGLHDRADCAKFGDRGRFEALDQRRGLSGSVGAAMVTSADSRHATS